MVKLFSLLLTLCLVACQARDDEVVTVCVGDEVNIDLSDPSSSKPLIYILQTFGGYDDLPPGLTLGRRSGVISGVASDPGSSMNYTLRVDGDDPTKSGTYTASVELSVKTCQGSRVSRFFLVDTVTDKIVRVVEDGDVIDLECEVGGFSMEAETYILPKKVSFQMDGNFIRTESVFPYALGGDTSGDYNSVEIAKGTHDLTATPFDASTGAVGEPKTISFTIV